MKRTILLLLVVAFLFVPLLPSAALAAPMEQQPSCVFFTETGGGQGGYSVCDDTQARFLTAFQRYGLQRVGYPISRRYERDGFVTQAFQKAIFQWRQETNSVAMVNIFDDLHNAGFDQVLLDRRQTPHQFSSDWDTPGATFDQIRQRRQSLLNARPAMRQAYFSVSDPLLFFGLPTSDITDMGNHYAIRLQRTVLQEWKEDVPWARAGQVTIANGADIAKELGGLPAAALVPEPSTGQPPVDPPSQPAPVVLTGSGTGISGDFPLPSGVLVAKAQYTGPSNFIVWLKNSATGERVDLLANEIGNYDGEQVFDVRSGTYFLDVDSEGPWTISIMTSAQRPTQPNATTYSFEGNGRGVPWMFNLRGSRVDYTVSYTGSSNFIIWIYSVTEGDRYDLLVNEIGSYSGTSAFTARPGLYMLDVEASGPWSITLTQR